MTEFTMTLAGVPLRVQALWPQTQRYCSDYLSDGEPRETLTLTQALIDAERAIAARDAQPAAQFSDAYLELLALHRLAAGVLLRYGAVVFHGSVLAVDGLAYLFTAPSGTGKTTHSRLWLSEVPGAHILNGDKPLILVRDGRIFACGTPWRGKERYGLNETLPLAAICQLERSETNHIEPISLHDALPMLIQQTHRPPEQALLVRTLELLGQIGQGVRLYRLGCNMEPEAARVSWAGMREGSGNG